MFEKYYPTKYYDSAYHIDYKSLYESGTRGLIYDIDNTLVPHNADGDDRSHEMLTSLQEMGFKICLLSNNDEERVKRFLETASVDAYYIYDAKKPSTKGYEAAAAKMGLTIDECVFVGDQIFTDVWGANRTGIYSILVAPMNPKEWFFIVMKRWLEKPIIKSYLKKHEMLTK